MGGRIPRLYIRGMLSGNCPLVDEPNQADLLAKAIAHFRVLRLASNEEISGEAGRFETFVYPRPLDKAVQDRIDALQKELGEISTPGWIENLLKL